MKDILVVIGPTAVGKTDFAVAEAQKTGAEIISADAFQVYRYMDIGTAKVSKEIRAEIPHHLIDIKDPSENYSVAEFLQLASSAIDDIRGRGRSIIICGGTAMYMKAFLYGYSLAPGSPDRPKDASWDQLNSIDPAAAALVHPSNQRRINRAWQIYQQTGQIPSQVRKREEAMRSDVHIIGMAMDRQKLIDRINLRVDSMIAQGLIEEVKSLLKMGISKTAQALEALGYKEIVQYLDGSLTKAGMIEWIKIRTRQFAKRQMTWYRSFDSVEWHNY